MSRELADAVAEMFTEARDARAHTTGVVTAYSGGLITATVDGGPVTGIRRIPGSYPSPTAGDVVLLAVVRSTSSVQYVALGVIT